MSEATAMTELKCGRCQRTMPVDRFWRDRDKRSGYKSHCKECCDAVRDPVKHAQKQARYAQRHPDRIAKRAVIKRRQTPEKHQARTAVSRAIGAGILIRPDACERCHSAVTVEAHHEDYTRVLDVVWLCQRCHLNIHGKELRREPPA